MHEANKLQHAGGIGKPLVYVVVSSYSLNDLRFTNFSVICTLYVTDSRKRATPCKIQLLVIVI